MSTETKQFWSGRATFILATIGAAVGLGNIWKFPYTLGSSGGSAFILIYALAILFVAVPIMLAEMIMGRSERCSAPTALKRLAAKKGISQHWSAVGWMGLAALFLVLSFYSVIAGWTAAYLMKAATGALQGLTPSEVGRDFGGFLQDSPTMVFWHLLFTAVTVIVVSRGLRLGLEKVVKYLMPMLFITLVALVVNSAVTGAFSESLDFLFSADLSKITPVVILAAVGQAFFSLNVGVGAVLTYSSYLPDEVSLVRSALIVALGDTAVALLAGLAIFPIVFSSGLDPAGGPGLIFVTLSASFAQMPAGEVVGVAFFAMLLVAALTSSISMLETMAARLMEFRGITRTMASVIIGSGTFLTGLITVLSFGIWKDVYLLDNLAVFANKTPFDLIDFLVSNILMPLGGMLYAIFAGWYVSKEILIDQLGVGSGMTYKIWLSLVRVVAPLAVAAVFLSNVV